METFSVFQGTCVGNSPVTGEFPVQRPVKWSFDFSLICCWINGWVNNREAGDLRRYRAHYNVTVMLLIFITLANPRILNWSWDSLPWHHMSIKASHFSDESTFCLFKPSLTLTTNKPPKLCITGLSAGNPPPVTNGIPAQIARNAESMSMPVYHHVLRSFYSLYSSVEHDYAQKTKLIFTNWMTADLQYVNMSSQ